MDFVEYFRKRKFRRLQINLDVSCRKISYVEENFIKGYMVNVSAGGLYFEIANDSFKPGDLLKLELIIPPTQGLLEFGGRISGFGKVLRNCSIFDSHTNSKSHSVTYEIAA